MRMKLRRKPSWGRLKCFEHWNTRILFFSKKLLKGKEDCTWSLSILTRTCLKCLKKTPTVSILNAWGSLSTKWSKESFSVIEITLFTEISNQKIYLYALKITPWKYAISGSQDSYRTTSRDRSLKEAKWLTMSQPDGIDLQSCWLDIPIMDQKLTCGPLGA